MVQNKEIKMAYLIVIVLLCVLGLQAMFEIKKSQKSLETLQIHPERIRTQRQ